MRTTPQSTARAHSAFVLLALTLFHLICLNPIASLAQDIKANEGADLAIGGPGAEPGQFLELCDITFDPAGNLYALDGQKINQATKQPEGNLRVQKFTRQGKLLASIDLRQAISATGPIVPQGDVIGPQRLAVSAGGDAFVTFPATGKVCRFGPDGRLTRTYDIPHAMAIAVWNGPGGHGTERVAVVASRHEVVPRKGWAWVDGDKISLIDPAAAGDATIPQAISFGQSFQNVQALAVDRAGNFYVKAEPNAIYQFSPEGKLLKTFGGNPTTRAEDGSEVLHTVTVDSKGNVYSMVWGNPGLVTRFDADGQTVTQRPGQFKWADPWSLHSSYVALAIDPDDRLWAAVCNRRALNDVHYKTQRAIPVIVRAKPDFFETPAGTVHVTPVRMLGFKPTLTCDLPYNVSHEPGKAVSMRLTVQAANRNVNAATVNWRVFDAMKERTGRRTIRPCAGEWQRGGQRVFVCPAAPWLLFRAWRKCRRPWDHSEPSASTSASRRNIRECRPSTPGQSNGGWIDPARQVFTGLPNMRIHPGKDEKTLAATDEQIAGAEKAGLTFIVQLVDNMKNLSPEYVRLIATRYKGRAKYYEICNEPNFSSNADDYFKGHKMAYSDHQGDRPAGEGHGAGHRQPQSRLARQTVRSGVQGCQRHHFHPRLRRT